MERLFAWHQAIFPSGRVGLSLILVGMFRGEEPMQVLSGPIGRERVHYEAPPRSRLDMEMEWLQWCIGAVEQACNNARRCIDRVIRVAHFWTRHRETPLSPRQRRLLEMALAPDDPEEGWLTAKRTARQMKVERVTASRDLARMEELGVIEKDPSAGGRSTRYQVLLADKEPLRLIDEIKWK